MTTKRGFNIKPLPKKEVKIIVIQPYKFMEDEFLYSNDTLSILNFIPL